MKTIQTSTTRGTQQYSGVQLNWKYNFPKIEFKNPILHRNQPIIKPETDNEKNLLELVK